MVLYECFRCGYNTKLKGNLKHHLNRKNVCDATEDDVEIDEIKKYYGIYMFNKIDPKMTQNDPKMTPNDPKMTPIRTPKYRPKKTPNDPFWPGKNPKKTPKNPK